MRHLRLYTRQGCHLCEDMQAQLQDLQAEHGFTLELTDLDREPGMQSAYGRRVPVLETAEGTCLCEHYLERMSLLNYLNDG